MLVIGEDELSNGVYRIKNMSSGEEQTVAENELINYFTKEGNR